MKIFYQVCFLLSFLGLIFIGFTPRVLAVNVSCLPLFSGSTILRCTAVSNNGPSNTNSGGCGTASMDLCDNINFTGGNINREECRGVMEETRSWTQYNVRSLTRATSNGWGGQPTREFSFFRAADICSTADKLTPGNLPRLRAGSCACGEGQVRGIYKVCCEREGSNWVPVNAVEYGTQDNFLPREGRCPTGSSVAWLEGPGQPLVAVRGPDGQLNCPGPPPAPTVTLTANPTSITAPGPSSRLTWDSTNTDSCRWTGGLIRPSTPVDGSVDVWPTATTTYTIECTGNNRITTASITVTVGQRPAPIICPPRESFNIVHGPRPGDTTVDITVDTTLIPPCRATCRRCSSNPSHIGSMATWTDDNFNINGGGLICDDGFNDVNFTPDPACACVANISASPITVSPGGASTLTWSTERALATGCNISGIGGPISNQGSRSVTNIQSTTTYTITCNAITGGGTCSSSVTVNVGPPPPSPPPLLPSPPGCVPDPSSSVTTSTSTTRPCLPLHTTNNSSSQAGAGTRDTNITWTGSVLNNCSAIIGGGVLSNSNIRCRSTTDNWSFDRQGSGSINRTEGSFRPTRTQDYTVECTRATYTCSNSATFSGGSTSSNLNACRERCNNLRTSFSNTLESCSCSQGGCVERGPRCVQWSTCWRTTTCTGTRINADGSITTYTYSCRRSYSCSPCQERECLRYAADQSVRSRQICPSSRSATQQIRFIQQPTVTRLETEPPRAQILLNQFINIVWNAIVDSSGVQTRPLMCTPSITRGDGRGWVATTNNMDSLPARGYRNLSPNRTTNYQLFCRNRDHEDSTRCFNDSEPREVEVRVFTPDLREVPVFYDNLLRIVGMVRGLIVPALAGSQGL